MSTEQNKAAVREFVTEAQCRGSRRTPAAGRRRSPRVSSARAISQLPTPFSQLTAIQTAGSHLSRPSGESSKVVPTLALICFLQPLHFHSRRALRNETSTAEQRWRVISGQRTAATKARQTANLGSADPSQERLWDRLSC